MWDRRQPKVLTRKQQSLTVLLMVALAGLPMVSKSRAADLLPPPSPDPVESLKALSPKLAPQSQPGGSKAQAGNSKQSNAPKTSSVKSKAPSKPGSGASNPEKTAGAGDNHKKADAAMPPPAPSPQQLSALDALEKMMFGKPQPSIPMEYRLDRLESEVFHQTNPEWQPKARITRLQSTLLGGPGGAPAAIPGSPEAAAGSTSASAAYPPGSAPVPENPYLPPLPTVPEMSLSGSAANTQTDYLPPPPELNSPEFNQPQVRDKLEQYAIELVNEMRFRQGLQPLAWDTVTYKLASDLVSDLCKRNTVSHQDSAGDNPDVRYTKAGGNDCMIESLVSVKTKGAPVVPNKALVYHLMKELVSHQDDRDALLASHATNFSFAFDISNAHDKIVGCAETTTKQADIDPIPAQLQVGDKVDIKGVIKGPYQFQKITVAWEGPPPPDDDDQEEAAPYFPPLDYAAFARKSEHDWQNKQKLIKALQIGGVGVAIAGSMFIPPVALAAPLIMAVNSNPKPRAVSEIPVHGGVHVDGQAFSYKAPLNKDNKEGIYYITVWAQSEVDGGPFAVSRRAVIVKPAPVDKAVSHKPEHLHKLVSVNDEKGTQEKR